MIVVLFLLYNLYLPAVKITHSIAISKCLCSTIRVNGDYFLEEGEFISNLQKYVICHDHFFQINNPEKIVSFRSSDNHS